MASSRDKEIVMRFVKELIVKFYLLGVIDDVIGIMIFDTYFLFYYFNFKFQL